MAVSQEPGPPLSDWLPLCNEAKVVFTVTILWGSYVWNESPCLHQWWARQRVTVVGNCRGRVNCKGSVFRQLASRWANDGPAGQLSRSQWVWLWDIPEVLVWTAWNPQGKQRPPTPWVSPAVLLTRASTAELPHQTRVQLCLCLLTVGRIYLRWNKQYIEHWWAQESLLGVLFCDRLRCYPTWFKWLVEAVWSWKNWCSYFENRWIIKVIF